MSMKNIAAISLLAATICLLSCDAFAETFTKQVPQENWGVDLFQPNPTRARLVDFYGNLIWTGGSNGSTIGVHLPIPSGCSFESANFTYSMNGSGAPMVFRAHDTGSPTTAPAASATIWGMWAWGTQPIAAHITPQGLGAAWLYVVFNGVEQDFRGATYDYSCPP